MEALNRHFTEVLLGAEVGEFVVADRAVVVAIIAEHILSDVFELIRVFLEESDEGSLDFFLIELPVLILVVNLQKLFSSFSNFSSKLIIKLIKVNTCF